VILVSLVMLVTLVRLTIAWRTLQVGRSVRIVMLVRR
jgi:hypothetical protein